MVSDAKREVMGRRLGDPPLQKCAHIRLEDPVGIGIAGRLIGRLTDTPSAITNLNVPLLRRPTLSMVIGPSRI